MSGLAAVLIDLDGTLVDTSSVWQHAYRRLADELTVVLPEEFWSQIVGRSMADSLSVFGDRERDASQTHPDVTHPMIARLTALAVDTVSGPGAGGPDGSAHGWRWMPGARELLMMLRQQDAAREHGDVRPATALVTSSTLAFTRALLSSTVDRAGWPEGAFDTVVCGEDVAHGKPAADSYLRAARLLGVAPTACLVIEDSLTGITAATAAGMVVLAVPRSGVIEPAKGRAVRRDLVGITWVELVALHARLRSGASD